MNADRTDHNPQVCYQLLDTLQKAVTLYKRRNEPGIGLAEVVQIENDLDHAMRNARSFLQSFPELGVDHLITPMDKREPGFDDCDRGNCWVSGPGDHMWEFTSPKSIRDWEGYVWLPHWAIPRPLPPIGPYSECPDHMDAEPPPPPNEQAALKEELSPTVPAPLTPTESLVDTVARAVAEQSQQGDKWMYFRFEARAAVQEVADQIEQWQLDEYSVVLPDVRSVIEWLRRSVNP